MMQESFNIFIGIPNTGTLRTELVEWIMKQEAVIFMPQAKPHDHCRNVIVNKFLETSCKWLMMVDSDIAPPDDVLEMIDNDADICSAYARTVINGELIPVGMTIDKEGYHHNFEHSKSELHKVDAVGTGCILIKRKVFEDMGKPYFEFVYKDGILIEGEDFNFCKRSKSDIFFDARYKCKHYTTMAI